MKNYKKYISFILVFCIMLTTFGSFSFAEQNLGQVSVRETLEITEDGVYINNVYYTQEEFGYLLDNAEVIETGSNNSNNNDIIAPMSLVLAAGTYYIVGIGTVVVTELGKIIVAGVIVKAGSWMYDKIMNWFKVRAFNKSAEDAINSLKPAQRIHILKKNDWKKFNKDPKWSDISPLLIKALQDGSETYRTSDKLYTRSIIIKGHQVAVRFKKSADGLVQYISTAWSNY